MDYKRVLSRRDFLKLSAGSTAALGLVLFKFPSFEKLFVASVAEVPVLWIQAGSCTGCSVSILNSLSPRIQEVLVSPVVPGKHISLRFHPTVMAGQGEIALQAIDDTAKNKGGYVLVVEGAVSTKDNGIYCEVGEANGQGVTALEKVVALGRDAMAVIALGACAFGGIPASGPNTTGCKSVGQILKDNAINTPIVNLPGCPPHPDWFVGTVATVLIGGLSAVELDDMGRPTAFYGKLIHDNCPRRGYFDQGLFAKNYSEPYCMFKLGCKGPVTYSDCPTRMWNSGTNWCVGANSPCIGCCNPSFPDVVAPFRKVEQLQALTPPSWLPTAEKQPKGMNPGLAAGIGAAAGIAVGATAMGVAKRNAKSEAKPEEKTEG
jgi:hydrogenase small subunit